MAYDAYGRPQRGGNEDYFPSNYTTSAEPRDNNPSARERSTSNARQRTYPTNERMTSSPDRAKPAGYDKVSPELIAEITAEITAGITERVKREVVEHLSRTGNVEDPLKTLHVTQASHAPPLQGEPSNAQVPQAPPLQRQPSNTQGPRSPSLQRQPSNAQAPQAPPLQRQPSNKSSSTSSPPPTARRVYTPPSPTQTQTPKPSAAVPPMEHVREPSREPVRSPPSSPLEKPSGVRFSDRTPTARPVPGRTFSTTELSTIDQKWGRLFDHEGHSTPRLGQFLRGLANHIIDDFEPTKSIVVTPTKMAKYYSSHPLDQEPNQLLSLFRPQLNEQISILYQDLGCQYHLVQDLPGHAPTIPALTALGFAQWMTLHILAYPDEEAKRLEKVVLAMPIDADGQMVDGKPERLPKQISRHLLPAREDRSSRKLVNKAISNFLGNTVSSNRRKASATSPSLSRHSSSQSRSHPVEIHQIRTSPTSSKAQPLERERNPYTGAPSTSESSGNEEPVKIERDRQPYTAQPGNGKVYTEGSNLNIPKLERTNSTTRREPDPIETREARHRRTRSNASQSSWVPPPRPGGRRTSSPPLKKYSDSSPLDIDAGGSKYGLGPSSTTSSFSGPSQPGSFPPPPPPIEIRDSKDRRSRDDRHNRRGTDEEARFVTGEFNSPKDAERWDRYQEEKAREYERPDRTYDSRSSVSVDPREPRDPRETSRDLRGAAYEDWYREKPRASGFETYARNY